MSPACLSLVGLRACRMVGKVLRNWSGTEGSQQSGANKGAWQSRELQDHGKFQTIAVVEQAQQSPFIPLPCSARWVPESNTEWGFKGFRRAALWLRIVNGTSLKLCYLWFRRLLGRIKALVGWFWFLHSGFISQGILICCPLQRPTGRS